jgi:hypothetical protein
LRCASSIRLELLQILESAARDTDGQLRRLVQYLATAEHGQDEREAEVLAQLTDAVVAALRRRLEN